VALDHTLPPMAGWMLQPAMGNHPIGGRPWGADNGCFAVGDGFDVAGWLDWLKVRQRYLASCLFAVVPDVVANARATLDRFAVYGDMVRDAGYPVALVAQDGLESLPVPWEHIDCLFIGGSTTWKLSEYAHTLIRKAQACGKWVHVGRVNSRIRLRSFAAVGVDSVDGTYAAFGPDVNGRRLATWLRASWQQPGLWSACDSEEAVAAIGVKVGP
jgi:hypothetical protein